ncbi:MAG: carbohydrate binding domain-containing protein [Bacteroidota bacterium]
MRPVLPLFLLLFPLFLSAQAFDDGFNFYLPPDDSTTQRFLPKFPKKTADKMVSISPDGLFLADGEPLRFWGMNMAYGACFPDKDDAPMIAARLRKMGVNLVRFAYMDSPWTNNNEGSIFTSAGNSTLVVDFFKLDRLHYFIAQLKAEGIYVNLILHHTRTFTENDGVLHADSIAATAKAVTMFDRQLIKLQKDFAFQLLKSVNTYTGLSLADDPVVALIDITNENTLYGYWKSDFLRHLFAGGDLIMRHVDTLNLRWNEFLQNKYASQTDLENTWAQTAGSGGQNEQVNDGNFEMGNPELNYIMELHDAAQATMTADNSNPYEGDFSARVDVQNVTGTNWHIQFKQSGASLVALKTYQIRFAARCDGTRNIEVVASRDNAPYTYYGHREITLTPAWQEFDFTFIAPENNDGNFRLGFQFLSQTGSYWFDELSMTEAEVPGVLPGESLTDGNIARMDYAERFEFSPHRMADNTEFYLTLQTAYFDEMYTYLKNELGVQANISGSNTWSGISDIYTARNMDFINDENIWDYIRYPNGWSLTNWLILNEPMVANGWSTMQNLFGGFALSDKPYLISQYSHPFPNRYQVEMMPWMTAYGSFHNASAITYNYYNDEHDSWTADRVDDYYSLHRNTAQMALSPVFAYAFRKNLVSSAEQVYEVNYSLPFLRALPFSDGSGRWGKYVPYNNQRAYSSSIKISGFEGADAPDLNQLPPAPGVVANTDTDETMIDFPNGILKTVTPNFISVTGFIDENEVEAGPLAINSANDFGVVSWLSLDEKALPESQESMLAVSSKLQNNSMTWDGTQSINNNWGSQPTEMFPLQLEIELNVAADYLQLIPLTPTGAEGTPKIIPPIATNRFLINIDQQSDRTLWYGIEAMEGPLSDNEIINERINVFPNPASEYVYLNWPNDLPVENITLSFADGKVIDSWKINNQLNHKIIIEDLSSGIYFLKINCGEKVIVEKIIVD